MVKPAEEGDAFVPLLGVDIDNILCRQVERAVGKDNCVSYQGRTLQLPSDTVRHYSNARVRVHEYPDGHLAVFHGPRCLAAYDPAGKPVKQRKKMAA